MRSNDYVLAANRGPVGWDYLIALAQVPNAPRLKYVAYCVERAIYGQG
ncbi:MAG: hypothetical protein [Podoviridae sp. ctpVR23]|nr:MAG: hypothetical protein [Podoviridae sp. ctpVR23]